MGPERGAQLPNLCPGGARYRGRSGRGPYRTAPHHQKFSNLSRGPWSLHGNEFYNIRPCRFPDFCNIRDSRSRSPRKMSWRDSGDILPWPDPACRSVNLCFFERSGEKSQVETTDVMPPKYSILCCFQKEPIVLNTKLQHTQ